MLNLLVLLFLIISQYLKCDWTFNLICTLHWIIMTLKIWNICNFLLFKNFNWDTISKSNPYTLKTQSYLLICCLKSAFAVNQIWSILTYSIGTQKMACGEVFQHKCEVKWLKYLLHMINQPKAQLVFGQESIKNDCQWFQPSMAPDMPLF